MSTVETMLDSPFHSGPLITSSLSIRKGEPLVPPPEKAREGWTPQKARQFETIYHQGRRRELRKRRLAVEREKAVREKEPATGEKPGPFPVRAEPAPLEKETVTPEEKPTTFKPTRPRQPLLWGTPEKRPATEKAKAESALEKASRLPVEKKAEATFEEPKREEKKEERLRKFVNEGWSPRVRNLKSGVRLTVRKREDGVLKEKYIGTYDEKMKEILEKMGLSVS